MYNTYIMYYKIVHQYNLKSIKNIYNDYKKVTNFMLH